MTSKHLKVVPIPVNPTEGSAVLLAAIKERVAKAQVRAHAAVIVDEAHCINEKSGLFSVLCKS